MDKGPKATARHQGGAKKKRKNFKELKFALIICLAFIYIFKHAYLLGAEVVVVVLVVVVLDVLVLEDVVVEDVVLDDVVEVVGRSVLLLV